MRDERWSISLVSMKATADVATAYSRNILGPIFHCISLPVRFNIYF
jgi:hypothetical protein